MGILRFLVKYAAVGTALVQTFKRTYYNVEGVHRAVGFNRLTGTKNKVHNEGTHFTFPYLEWPVIYDIRARPFPF